MRKNTRSKKTREAVCKNFQKSKIPSSGPKEKGPKKAFPDMIENKKYL